MYPGIKLRKRSWPAVSLRNGKGKMIEIHFQHSKDRVPELEPDNFVINLHRFRNKIDSNCCIVRAIKLILPKNSIVSQEEQKDEKPFEIAQWCWSCQRPHSLTPKQVEKNGDENGEKWDLTKIKRQREDATNQEIRFCTLIVGESKTYLVVVAGRPFRSNARQIILSLEQ